MTVDELKATILQKYIAILEHDVHEDADFFDEGGDSVAVEVILSELSHLVGHELPGWLLLDNPSAAQLSKAVYETINPA
jgi:acyl carrier protein